jgi:hypothetical protein
MRAATPIFHKYEYYCRRSALVLADTRNPTMGMGLCDASPTVWGGLWIQVVFTW